MKNTNTSIKDIQEDLESLDTEYREALAKALMDLKYIKDTEHKNTDRSRYYPT